MIVPRPPSPSPPLPPPRRCHRVRRSRVTVARSPRQRLGREDNQSIGRIVMPEIAEWLKALGMSEYAERFAENGIDFSVLCHLTDQDLRDIGVLLGHRRKLLAAIAERAGAVPAGPQPALTEPRSHDVAERRQLTMLFCDLVGSTALASRLDPEDLREIIGSYHRCVADTVGRFDGFVAKYM